MPGSSKRSDDVAAHRILGAADAVRADQEAHGQLQPVVGDAEIDVRAQIDRLDAEARSAAVRLASAGNVFGSMAWLRRRLQQNVPRPARGRPDR